MQAFTDFILQVTYPPNPIRNLDNSLTAGQQAGRDMYLGAISDTLQNCNGCHRLIPTAGFFGTDGFSSFEGETQIFKVPHLRNAYQKVGMFGLGVAAGGGAGNTGPQVRGFGFLHDGSVDTLFRFHSGNVFTQTPTNPGGFLPGAAGDPLRRSMEAFVLAFDSNLAPIVGQQITRTATSPTADDARITLMMQRADAGECDLIAKGMIDDTPRGFLYVGGGAFVSDRAEEPPIADGTLRALANAAGQELTYTCAPPGSGARIGLDRDGDGVADSDERDAGTDPANAGSLPGDAPMICITSIPVVFKSAKLTDHSGTLSLTAEVALGAYAQEAIGIVASDGDGTITHNAVSGSAIAPKGSGFRYRAASGASGIRSISVKESRKTPGTFKVALRTTHAWQVGAANQDATTTLVTLNVGGHCFRGPATRVK
jgi:hypothetical protein